MKLTCKEAAYLVSCSQEHRLSAGKWLALRLHLLICVACARFARHVRFLRVAASRARRTIAALPAIRLSNPARRRLVRALRRQRS